MPRLPDRLLLPVILALLLDGSRSIQLVAPVPAPVQTPAGLKIDNGAVDFLNYLGPNVTQYSTNLTIVNKAGSNLPSDGLWTPLNSTMAVSVIGLGTIFNPNGTALIFTRIDVRPFVAVSVVVVQMPTSQAISEMTPSLDAQTVFVTMVDQFLGFPVLVAEISLTTGAVLRQFNASKLSPKGGVSQLIVAPSLGVVLALLAEVGVLVLDRTDLSPQKLYRPADHVFPFLLGDNAILIAPGTLAWLNLTEGNTTEMRVWDYATEPSSRSIPLATAPIPDVDPLPAFLGIDPPSGNIWAVFVDALEVSYLASSVIYHIANATSAVSSFTALGSWLCWAGADQTKSGAVVIEDSLFVSTLLPNSSVALQKYR